MRLAMVVALVAGCRGETKSLFPTDQELLVLIDRTLAMQEAMVRAGRDAGADCARFAGGMDRVIAEYQDLLDPALIKRQAVVADRFDRLVNERRVERYREVQLGLREVIGPCASDPALIEALQPLDL